MMRYEISRFTKYDVDVMLRIMSEGWSWETCYGIISDICHDGSVDIWTF